MTLDMLKINQVAVVTALHSNGLNRRRLMDLGILPGTRIEVEMEAPLNDPVAYRVRGSVVALRRDQSQAINIQLENES